MKSMRKGKTKSLSTLGAALLTTLLSVGSSQAADIDIVGTGDGMSVLQSVASAFMERYPEHTVNVPDSIGSSGGIKAVGNDKYVLGRVARGLKEKEQPYGLTTLTIAKFPVVFFVNKDVTVQQLNAQQVLEIYSGKLTDWQQVGGDKGKIRVVRREEGDSSLSNLRKTFPGFKEMVITERSKTATLTQENLDIVEQKSGTIGFGPYAGAKERNLTILTIDGKQPTQDDYPYFGTLSLIFKEKNRTGVVADFINFVRTPEAKQAIRSAHAIPAE